MRWQETRMWDKERPYQLRGIRTVLLVFLVLGLCDLFFEEHA